MGVMRLLNDLLFGVTTTDATNFRCRYGNTFRRCAIGLLSASAPRNESRSIGGVALNEYIADFRLPISIWLGTRLLKKYAIGNWQSAIEKQ
jgi:hypothetical protein